MSTKDWNGKEMKKIITILMMVVVLTGCSGEKEVITTGKGSSYGMATEFEIISKGDEVLQEKNVTRTSLKTLGLTEEQVKESISLAGEQFNGIDGVTFKVDVDNDKVIITIKIDYRKADIGELNDELKKAGLLDSTSDAKRVSLKLTKEKYEKLYGVVFEK